MTEVPLISVTGLGKRVGSGEGALTLLENISFTVMAGQTLALQGASGAGKSTLLGLLAGLDEASTGDAVLAGRSLRQLDEEARTLLRRELIGFVFQSFQLLPHLTALENVMLPLEIAGQGAGAELEARDWLTRVGLAGRLHHFPATLSGGEQQRVALARAFAPRPALILADEPTGNLDTATGGQIADLMFELNAHQGTTLILVTHDPVLAARCGRQLRMSEGRISESAAPPAG